MLEAQHALLGMVDTLLPGSGAADIMRTPPLDKFRAFPPKTLRQAAEGGLVRSGLIDLNHFEATMYYANASLKSVDGFHLQTTA